MSQRSLFVILLAVLFAACEDDTIVSLNAVNFTKSTLSKVAESARHAAERTDILAARLAVFTDSAAVFADSAITFADSAEVAAALFAAANYHFRVAEGDANSFFGDNSDEAKIIEKTEKAYHALNSAAAHKAYKVARRTAFAAYIASVAAYDVRNDRLAPRSYKVALRTAEQAATTARRAADEADAALAAQADAQADAYRTAATADSFQAAVQASQWDTQTDSDKAARLRLAYGKDAAAQAATRRAAAARRAAQAAQTASAARRAAAQTATKATKATKVYAVEAVRLRRAYSEAAVKAAYDVAYAGAYAAAYASYPSGALGAAHLAADRVIWDAPTASYAEIREIKKRHFRDYREVPLSFRGYSFPRSATASNAAYQAYVTYVDTAGINDAYNTASALFKAAYAADSVDPQSYAAQAYAAQAQAVAKAEATRAASRYTRRYKSAGWDSVYTTTYAARIAVRDSAYVIPPISTAIAALVASKAAYQAYAASIDSLLNSLNFIE